MGSQLITTETGNCCHLATASGDRGSSPSFTLSGLRGMTMHELLYPANRQSGKVSLHDQVQIALAIAEVPTLKSLLVNCTPPIAPPHHIGHVSSTIGVPIEAKTSVDGIIQFEQISCVLTDAPVETNPQFAAPHGDYSRWQVRSITRCESETQTLGTNLSLAQAISVLAHAGFSPKQVDDVLNLPNEAWHKSWWYALDAAGEFTIPFLRMMRPLRYSNGTFTLQYKDHYSQDKPPCFKNIDQKVLVQIKTEQKSFKKVLEKINYSRDRFGISKAILICDELSDFEARGFISQGISIFSRVEPLTTPQANCTRCINADCPMQGQSDSPVVVCRRFCLDPTCS
jgi:bacterioferritin-associated ferredoxin